MALYLINTNNVHHIHEKPFVWLMLRTRLLKTVYSANDPRQLPTAHAVGAGEAGPSGVS